MNRYMPIRCCQYKEKLNPQGGALLDWDSKLTGSSATAVRYCAQWTTREQSEENRGTNRARAEGSEAARIDNC